MLKYTLCFVALLATPALAQQQQPPSASADVTADWNMLIGAASHVGRSIQALVQENTALKAENEKLKKEVEDTKKQPVPLKK